MTRTSISRRAAILAYALLLLSPLVSAQLSVSEDGNCGAAYSQTCLGSRYGDCCSGKGFCGADPAYCAADCQPSFGTCTYGNASASISINGDCGATDPERQICTGSEFGDSCSKNGFCGSGDDFAGEGCQADYGICDALGRPTTGSGSASSTVTPSGTRTGTGSVATASASASASNSATVSPSESAQSAAAASGTAVSDSSDAALSSSKNSDDGLSTGAKAGIAVGAVAVAALVAAGIFFCLRRRRQQQSRFASDAPKDLNDPNGQYPAAHSTKPSMSDISSPTMTMSSNATTAVTPPAVPPYSYPHDKASALEMPLEHDRRTEMRSGPATPGFMPPVEKDAGVEHVISELPGQRWSTQ